jgi:hypothetical protein
MMDAAGRLVGVADKMKKAPVGGWIWIATA